MNFLERAIAAVSPRTGAQRLYYRAMIQSSERVFEAAKIGRRTSGWVATGSSPNVETGNGLDRLRWRARDLERNNGLAAGIFRKLPAYLVGSGIRVRPGVDDQASKDTLRKNWNSFVRTSDIATRTNFDAQMKLAARTVVRDGEVLLVWHDMPDPRAPLAVHVLEADHLDTLKNQPIGDNVIIQGVEFDRDGRRVAYWLFDQHPGEVVLSNFSRTLTSRRVDAERVDHIFDVLRPGQARGIPLSAPVMMRLRDVQEYEDAELVRKKVEACFAVFVKQSDQINEGRIGTNVETETDPATGKTRKLTQITPGIVQYLLAGEEVSFAEPKQSIGVADYLKNQWLSIAAGVGMPYYMATGDVSNANYGSQRAAMLDFWALLDDWQWNMLVPMAYERAYQRVGQAFARLGQGPREFSGAAYAMPKRNWIDPDKDGKATERDLRIGRLAWPQMVSEAGEDPEEQFTLLEEWQTKLAKLPTPLDFGSKAATDAAGQSAPDDSRADAGDGEPKPGEDPNA